MALSRKLAVEVTGRRSDRRRSCRYPTRTKAAVVGWDVNGCRVELPGEFEDISMNGCRVRSRLCPVPTTGEPIWLQVSDEDPPEWVEGVVIATNKPFLRKSSTRIRFRESLPYHTFKMLVYGPEGQDLELSERPEHEADYLWR